MIIFIAVVANPFCLCCLFPIIIPIAAFLFFQSILDNSTIPMGALESVKFIINTLFLVLFMSELYQYSNSSKLGWVMKNSEKRKKFSSSFSHWWNVTKLCLSIGVRKVFPFLSNLYSAPKGFGQEWI